MHKGKAMLTNSSLKVPLSVFALLTFALIAQPVAAAETWGCSPAGTRHVAIHLIDRGSRSYVKINGKRIPATIVSDKAGRRWNFYNQSVVLSPNNNASYYVDGALKGEFVCRPFGK